MCYLNENCPQEVSQFLQGKPPNGNTKLYHHRTFSNLKHSYCAASFQHNKIKYKQFDHVIYKWLRSFTIDCRFHSKK